VFNLYNREWPIFSQQWNSPPAKFVRDSTGRSGTAVESIVSLGCVISGATIERCVLSPWVTIDSGATVTDAVLFEKVHIHEGATVQRAILDKEVVVAPGATVGVDHELDRSRGFTVTPSGIVVVEKGVLVE
jgi:glucose-1-phosphate adenylyltransferase